MRTVILMLGIFGLIIAPQAGSQDARDPDPGQYWHAVDAEKRTWVKEHMQLSAAEAAKFWPLYAQYQNDLSPIMQQLTETLAAYGERYRNNSLTDNDAQKLMARALKTMQKELGLRRTYLKRISRATSGKTATRYVQLEGRFFTTLIFELSRNVPLVGDSSSPAEGELGVGKE